MPVKIGQIPFGMALPGQMGDDDIAVIYNGHQPHRLMDWLLPHEIPFSFEQLGPVFLIKIIHGAVLQLVGIFHLYDLNLGKQLLL